MPCLPCKTLRIAATLACAAALSLGASGSPPAQQTPQFRTTVEIVQLQVGVEGPDGEFVAGLVPEDFVLRINGKERPVQVAYEVDLRVRPEIAVAAVAAVADTGPAPRERARPVAARRHFLVLFDFSFTTRRGVLEARRAALEFVESSLHPDDLMAVATYNRFGFKLLSPFTADRERAREAIGGLGLAQAGDRIVGGIPAEESITQALAELQEGRAGTDGDIGQALSETEFREYTAEVADYAASMRELGHMLQGIEGRKHVILFSSGFDDRALVGQSLGQLAAGADARAAAPSGIVGSDPEQLYGSSVVREGLEEMIQAFRSADAVIHAVDPSGIRAADNGPERMGSPLGGNLSAASDLSSLAGRNGHQALTAMSEGTGGTASWNLNNLTVALDRIEGVTAAYYVIGYRKEPGDPATVSIDVRLRRSRAKVVSVPRRLAPPPAYRAMSEAQRQLQLAEALADDVDRRDIAFEAQVVPFPESGERGRLAVVLEVPGVEVEALARDRGDERLQLELAALALRGEQTVVGAVRRGITVQLDRMRARGPLATQALRIHEYIDVPPGEYRVRVLLRETEVGRLSTRTLGAYLGEPPSGLDVARPLVLAEGSAPARPGEGSTFDPLAIGELSAVPEASPILVPGRPFRVLVIVYNLPRHPVSGEIQAGIVLELADAAEEVYRVRDVEVLGSRTEEGDRVTQLVVQGTVPPEVPGGTARLWAIVIDRLTGLRNEEQALVFVAGAAPTPGR